MALVRYAGARSCGQAGVSRPLTAEVVTTLERAEQLAPAWDRLAVESGCPGAAPAWQLAWWHHLAPRGAELRIVALHEQEQVVGVAPFHVRRTRAGQAEYRLLAASMTHRLGPVTTAAGAGAAIAGALAAATPAPDYVAFDAADAAADPLSCIRAAWPRTAPWVLRERTMPAPVLHLAQDGFAEWLGGKSRNFRQQTRRFRRRLAEAGGRVRLTSSLDELEVDVAAFLRLHHERWSTRGGSSLDDGIGGMLLESARALLPSGRFRLWVVELDGRPVSAQVFLAAGGDVLYWNGGFEPTAAQFKPALLGILAGIEDAFERGERRIDLGGGAHDYKLRLADDDRPLEWSGLVPHNRRYARNRAALVPRQLRSVAREGLHRLPPAWQRRIEDVRREGTLAGAAQALRRPRDPAG